MPAPCPGRPFGAFFIESLVGEGGTGVVFRARDNLDRHVALKVLREARDPADGSSAAVRFVREARLAAKLSHPGIARIYNAGEIEGTPYIAMEWVDGVTLKAAAAGLSIRARLALLGEVAEILAYAHKHGVIHRDVKPSNVLIDRGGHPKLVDFGIAKDVTTHAGEHAATFTATGALLGTPSYMAPEQMASSHVDGRADQYAWAVMAFEVLSGVHPLVAPRKRAGSALPPGVPDAAAKALERAMSDAPSARFATMQDLLAAWRGSFAPSRAKPLFVFGLSIGITLALVGAFAVALSLWGRTKPEPSAKVPASAVSLAEAAETAASAPVPSLVPAPESPSVAPASPNTRPRCTCVGRFARIGGFCLEPMLPSCTCGNESTNALCPRPWEDDEGSTAYRSGHRTCRATASRAGHSGTVSYGGVGKKTKQPCTGYPDGPDVPRLETAGFLDCEVCYGPPQFRAAVPDSPCTGIDVAGTRRGGRWVCEE